MAKKLKLYRCEPHSAWISLKQCARNRENEKKSPMKTVIDGIPTCRGCPGISKLPDVEEKVIAMRTRPGQSKANKRGRMPSARSVLHHTMKKRLERKNMEADGSE